MQGLRNATRAGERLNPVLVFAGFALLFLALLPPTNYASDGESMLAVSNSLASGPSLKVPCHGVSFEPGRNGDCYSTYYPLLSFLGAPFYLVGKTVGSAADVSQTYMGEAFALIVPALAAAGAASLTALLSMRLGASRRAAVLAALALGFCTEVITYARSFFAESLAAFFVALAVWGFAEGGRRRVAGMGAAALAMLAKPQMVLIGPAIGLAFAVTERRVRPLQQGIAGAAVGTLLYAAYNWARFGDVTNFGGETRELHSSAYSISDAVQSLGLLLISPGRGFLLYSPIVIPGLVVLWRRRREGLALACLLCFVALVLVYVGNPGTGNNWADRYFVPALPLLVAGVACARGALAKVAVTLAVIGLLVQLPTMVVDYHRYYVEQAEAGHKSADRYWTFPEGPLLGAWPAAGRQLGDARDNDVRTLVAQGDPDTHSGASVESQPPLQVISLWWWVLPAAHIPAALGAVVSLGMILAGLWLLRRATEPPAGPSVRRKPAPAGERAR